MLRIRFLRLGKRNQPFYRIVVTERKNSPQSGRFIEILGFYNPVTKETNLKVDRIQYWLSVGAQTSETVHNLLIKEKVIAGKKIPVHSSRKKPKKEELQQEKDIKEDKGSEIKEEVKSEKE
jgi:small subunit ribosomal protein S16